MLLDDDSSLLASEDTTTATSAAAIPAATSGAKPAGMEDVDLAFDELLTPEEAASERGPVLESSAEGPALAASTTDASPLEDETCLVSISFEQNGSLGIEFVELEPPYIVQEIHSGGLAHGRDLRRGDRLKEVSGEVVCDLQWEAVKERLMRRPMVMTFLRTKDDASTASEGPGTGLFSVSGLTGRMRLLGGSVAQQSLGLGAVVSSAAAAAGSAAAAAGSAAAVASTAAGTAAAKAIDLKKLDVAKDAIGNMSGAATSKLTTLFSEMNDDTQQPDASGPAPGADATEADIAGDEGWATEADVAALADMAAESDDPPKTDNSNSNGDVSLSGWECLEHSSEPKSEEASVQQAEDKSYLDDAHLPNDAATSSTADGLPEAVAHVDSLSTAEVEQLREALRCSQAEVQETREAKEAAEAEAQEARKATDAAIIFKEKSEQLQKELLASQARTEISEAEVNRLRQETDAGAKLKEESRALEEQLSAERSRAEALAASEQAIKARCAELEAEVAKAAKGAEAEVTPDDAAGTVEKMTVELQAKSQEVASLTEMCDTLREEVARMKKEMEAAGPEQSDAVESTSAELQASREEVARLSASCDALRAEIEGARKEAEATVLEHAGAVEKTTADLQAKSQEVASLTETCDTLREEVARIKKESEAGGAEQSDAAESISAELQARTEEVARLSASCEALKADIEGAKKEAEAAAAQHSVAVERAEKAAEQAAAELQAKTSEVAAAQDQIGQALERASAAEAASHAASEKLDYANTSHSELEVRHSALQTQHAEAAAQSAAEATRTAEEVKSLQASLKAEQEAREQDRVKFEGQLEQLRFILADKDKQLQDKVEVIARKEQEVKSMLRQLEAAGDLRSAGGQEDTDGPVEMSEVATTFEVMFALGGSLGLQFEQLAAPYVVEAIIDTGVAAGLDILPGDELVAVGGEAVTEAVWSDLRERLQVRPVVARFRRDPGRQKGAQTPDGSSLLSSVLNVAGNVAGNVARNAAPRKSGAPEPQQDSRLELEVERLGMLLKGRDEELTEVRGQLRQREEALRLLEAGNADASGVSALAQEREALNQQVQQLQPRLADAEKQIENLSSERDRLGEQYAEEFRLREEHRQQVVALTEQNNSLMTQIQSINSTCQSLSADVQQKAAMEAQVQELMRMNASWQQAHQSLNMESEHLRQRAEKSHQLESEVDQLREYQRAYARLEERLQEAEASLDVSQRETVQLRNERSSDHDTIQRLQAVVEAIQESGESEAGHLEAELLERSRECASLRRDAEEQRRRVEDLLKSQQDWREAMDQSRSLKAENEDLRKDLAATTQEKDTLHNVVTRCVEKLEKESRERPHLVDKRMVTQMVAAYLEQRDNPKQAQEIMAKMADLLGFTTTEREQVGLTQRRKTLLEHQEPASLSDLADGFVDFLLEESETN